MKSDKGRLSRRSHRGIAFLEYALLAALVGIVGATGAALYGEQIYNFFKTLAAKTAEVNSSK